MKRMTQNYFSKRSNSIFNIVILFFITVMSSVSFAESVRCTKSIKKYKRQPEQAFFHYDTFFKTLEIGGSITYLERDDWVKKLFIIEKGFIVAMGQKVFDRKLNRVIEKHWISQYLRGGDFKTWQYVPLEDVKAIKTIYDIPQREPDVQYTECKSGGLNGIIGFVQNLISFFRF